MPLSDLSMNHLDGPAARYEPQRANHGVLRIHGFDFGGNDASVLELAVKTFPMPKSTTNVSEIDFINHKRKFPGKTTYDDIAVTFNDYIDGGTARAIAIWRERIKGGRDGRVGLKSEIARDGLAIMFAPDGSKTRSFVLKGIWPSSDDFGDIDYASDEPVIINVTFTIDLAIPGIANVKLPLLEQAGAVGLSTPLGSTG